MRVRGENLAFYFIFLSPVGACVVTILEFGKRKTIDASPA